MSAPQPSKLRLIELTGALTRAVHAGQMVLQSSSKTPGAPELFGLCGLTLDQAKQLKATGERLAALPSEALVAWASEAKGADEAGKLVAELSAQPRAGQSRLPLNVFRAFLAEKGRDRDEASARACANLFQLLMEVNRDGDWLQDLFRVYIAVGLKVCLSQLGLPASDADLERYGRELAPRLGKCPFGTTPLDVHMILKKMEMWGEKNTGRRDKFVLARELLEDPDVKPLIPKLKALPPKRVAILGHSMTMSLHWATYASWIDMACELMRLLQPTFEYQGFQTGGIDSIGAERIHLANLIAWKPGETYMLMVMATPEQRAAYERIVTALRGAGSEVYCVDDVRPFLKDRNIDAAVEHMPAICKKTGAHLLAFNELGKQGKGWQHWQALGGDVHMITDGHVFYAKELLKRWAGVS
ncbi:MAG: hypothetical protein HY291_14430 [Planctomycetes bacterium]|nr:hypothetical protein [Planctomycetota bacterium]